MAAASKDLKQLIKVLREQGFEVVEARKHWVVKRDGRTVVVMAGTPSDWRSWANMVSALRRAGAHIPRKGQK
jgi:hypothetical protein